MVKIFIEEAVDYIYRFKYEKSIDASPPEKVVQAEYGKTTESKTKASIILANIYGK